jgi:hypothetical protein
VTTDTHATIEELLEAVFFMQSDPRLYKEDQQDKPVSCHHELITSQLPSSKDLSMEAEEYLLLGAVT